MIFIILLIDYCLIFYCDYICINMRVGFMCVCFDGFEFNYDGKSCIGNVLIYVNFVIMMCCNYNVKYKNSIFFYFLVFK